MKSVILWIFLNGEEWGWKQTVTSPLLTAILSSSLDTQKGKNLISFFTLSKSASSICLCHREISPLPHSHSTTEHPRMIGQGAPSRGQAAEPQGRGEKAWSSSLCGTVNSNLRGWNPHPLVQTHLRFPRQCHLIDSACVEGLGAVYTECQASARQLSVSGQVVEWVASDVGGWKGAELSGGEGGWSKVLPQDSETLVWPAGFGCLREELLLLLLQLFISGTGRHTVS